MELVIFIRYKIHMFGIIIGGTFNAFCNNESFYKNDLFADSKLKNKNESICLHRGTK